MEIRAGVAIVLALAGVLAVTAASEPPPSDPPATGQADEPTGPIEVDKLEAEKVQLVLLDVVVVDREGRTVPDLSAEDFEIVTAGRTVAIDTLDVNCPGGSAEEPVAVRHPSRRDMPVATDGGRRVVLALDYLHLSPMQRVDVLERAKDMVEHGAAERDEFMVAALTGGLRIEQPFTTDHERVMRALHRMEYDISLWNGNFRHLNETGFVAGLTTLFDVLGTVPGNKAVVLYSAMSDVPLDSEFQRIAGIASASRCSIYPVDAWGLRPLEPGGVPAGGGG